MKSELRLHWQKGSFKRYYARVGPHLCLEVLRFTPYLGAENRWRLGELFGSHFVDMTFEAETLTEAQLEAERLAPELLRQALKVLTPKSKE
jgi:hypothetical protein